MCGCVQYSPLCDTNLVAYERYLRAFADVCYHGLQCPGDAHLAFGRDAFPSRKLGICDVVGGDDRGRVDVRDHLSTVRDGRCVELGERAEAIFGRTNISHGDEQNCGSNKGYSGGGADVDAEHVIGSCPRDSGPVFGCDGENRGCSVDRAIDQRSGGEGRCDERVLGEKKTTGECAGAAHAGDGCDREAVNSDFRGPNYERNKKNRMLQKERRLRRKAAGDNWRSPKAESCVGGVEEGTVKNSEVVRDRGVGFKEGFFVECSDATKRELRESRAAVLIAENKRRALEEVKRMERLEKKKDPVADFVWEMVRVTRMTEQLKKQTKDTKISGWAETIADSLSKSTASSGPSSVPSIESVQQKESALKSEGDCVPFDREREIRLMEYNLRKVQLDDYYEQLDGYGIEEHDRAYAALKNEFEDVSKSEIERQTESAVKKISDSMQQAGIDQYSIQDIMERAGFEYDA